jgi:hypothetical protein
MQELIVGLIVLGAILYLLQSVRRASKGGCGCGTSGCAKKAAAPAEQLIQISLDKRH